MTDFLLRRRATFDPPRFQGWGRQRHYFEGWYFKVVVAEHDLAYAFIPGISYDRAGEGHAFLQVLNGVAATSEYHEYRVDQFDPAPDRFHLQLGPHTFATDRLKIDLPDLQLDLRFLNTTAWPARATAPGVMGWYGYVPGMQCYHGLVSFHHRTLGSIRVGQHTYDASSGIGYTEKDWGTGFPDAWIWTQSNHLSHTTQPASLMASVASIPWLGNSFTGFLCTLLLEGELHVFTTWARAQVRVHFGEGGEAVRLVFSKQDLQLTLTGHPAPGGHLASPIAGAMTGKINESLQAEVEVLLERGGNEVYRGTASWAGLEVSDNARGILGRGVARRI
ncbi:hypothetical protein LEM8419_02387 [Neolewinella maritima]|uniref:Tocopherol cyclase n=1 Tax=Neolewinella maritima TaxID=1383882 RepID=A0ABN8FA47_9BACT|nr:tocopherol cyclase family protein [Neolewinella maritima]CAH1001484.1 hypothetical protein LEM8419_02387 [Neolewinella maritima]